MASAQQYPTRAARVVTAPDLYTVHLNGSSQIAPLVENSRTTRYL
jgi:hypothetical protein